MTDLAILVPSRGRPENVQRLIEACARTCKTDYMLSFGFDDDDETMRYAVTRPEPEIEADWTVAPRMSLTEWTNLLASEHEETAYLASLGDDMLPVTEGWDERIITAIEHQGGGYGWSFNGRRADIPEFVIVGQPVVRALGWFALPALHHWYIDNVWRDLGAGAGRLAYLPDVRVLHLHPAVTGQPGDQTYGDAAAYFDEDLKAYQWWRLREMRSCIQVVREAC